jgi:hypothetical protein
MNECCNSKLIRQPVVRLHGLAILEGKYVNFLHGQYFVKK